MQGWPKKRWASNLSASVFHGACFGAVSAPTLYAPYPRRVGLPGEDKARTKSAPQPLQNTLHGKRA